MATERKPTAPRQRTVPVLLRPIVHNGREHPAGEPIPSDLTSEQKLRLKRLGAIK